MADNAAFVVSPPPYATGGSDPVLDFSEQNAKAQEAAQAAADDQTPPAAQQQPGPAVMYVVRDVNANTGQIQLPTVINGQLYAGQETKSYKTFLPQIILSCFVLWLFGCLFGFIAFILAMLARHKQSSAGPNAFKTAKTARDLGKASYVTSIVGIIVAVVIVFACLVALLPVNVT